MRRTVIKGEFSPDRYFRFIKVAYGDIANLDLLVCTASADVVGVRGYGSVFLFDKSVREVEDFAGMAEVNENQVFVVDIRPTEGSNYLSPILKDFKASLTSVKKFMHNRQEFLVSPEKKSYIEHCLGFIIDFCFRGVVYPWTRGLVTDSLALKFSAAGKGIDLLITKNDWEAMSNAWFCGLKKWTSDGGLTFDIEDEISIVKAQNVEMELLPVKYNPKNQMMRQQEMMEVSFRDRVGQFSDSKMRGLLNAWIAAKNGCDYEEYFDDAKYAKEDEAAAREAFKEAWNVYFG